MSRDFINIRLGMWHLMIGAGACKVLKNEVHRTNKKWFEVYSFFGRRK